MSAPKFGVIASIAENSAKEVINAFYAAIEMSIVSIELRLDHLHHRPEELTDVIEQIVAFPSEKPVILTMRGKEQGGSALITLEEQYDFWRTCSEDLRDLIEDPESEVFVDMDLELVEHITEERGKPPLSWQKIGVSRHDFHETPRKLQKLLEELEDTPAEAFLKLVTTAAGGREDGLRHRELLQSHRDDRPLIAFAMGEFGEESRRKCLSWGSAGTYGFLPGYGQTAPGQVSVIELLRDPDVQRALSRS